MGDSIMIGYESGILERLSRKPWAGFTTLWNDVIRESIVGKYKIWNWGEIYEDAIWYNSALLRLTAHCVMQKSKTPFNSNWISYWVWFSFFLLKQAINYILKSQVLLYILYLFQMLVVSLTLFLFDL